MLHNNNYWSEHTYRIIYIYTTSMYIYILQGMELQEKEAQKD